MDALTWILIIVYYFYFSLCFYFIAKKNKTGNSWYALIPIYNLYYFTKVSKVNGLWSLVFYLTIVFIVIFYFYSITYLNPDTHPEIADAFMAVQATGTISSVLMPFIILFYTTVFALFASFAFSIWLSVKLLNILKKSDWLALTLWIPFIQLITLSIIAFSKE